ncbi:MAG TPA: hypothetical protein DEF07_05790 [Nitrosomonas sp.]|nr:hypothetical protein [Nitrosomonas sp.]
MFNYTMKENIYATLKELIATSWIVQLKLRFCTNGYHRSEIDQYIRDRVMIADRIKQRPSAKTQKN